MSKRRVSGRKQQQKSLRQLQARQMKEKKQLAEKQRAERHQFSVSGLASSTSQAPLALSRKPPSYREKLRALRGVADIPQYKRPERLNPKTKARITNLYKIVAYHKTVGDKFVPTASEKRKEALHKYSGGYRSKYLKGGFLPAKMLGATGKIVWESLETFRIETPKLPDQIFVPVDSEKAFKDPEGYLRALLAPYPETSIFIPVQEHGIHKAAFRSKEQCILHLIKWINAYNTTTTRMAEWFLGFKIITNQPRNYKLTDEDRSV